MIDSGSGPAVAGQFLNRNFQRYVSIHSFWKLALKRTRSGCL